MTSNKHKATVPFKVGEKEGTLHFNMEALAEVSDKFSRKDLEQIGNMNPRDVAWIAEIGFKEFDPDIKADDILKAEGVAFFQLAQAVDNALLYAYHGPETAEMIKKEMEDFQKKVEADIKKAGNAGAKKKKSQKTK